MAALLQLVPQNQKELFSPIQKFGCRFRCLQAIAEIESGKQLSCGQILDTYIYFSRYPEVLNENCLCGSQEHKIINHTFEILGVKKKGRQVGTIQDGKPLGWDGNFCLYDFSILHWSTSTSDGHYTLADKNLQEIFDPWDHQVKKLKKLVIRRQLLYKIFDFSS